MLTISQYYFCHPMSLLPALYNRRFWLEFFRSPDQKKIQKNIKWQNHQKRAPRFPSLRNYPLTFLETAQFQKSNAKFPWRPVIIKIKLLMAFAMESKILANLPVTFCAKFCNKHTSMLKNNFYFQENLKTLQILLNCFLNCFLILTNSIKLYFSFRQKLYR